MVDFSLVAFLGVFFVAIIIGLIIYIIKSTRIKDEPDNADIIINCLSDYTNGYALGLIDEKKGNKEKYNYTMLPRDINYIKLRDKKIDIKPEHVFVKRKLLVDLGLSGHRNMFLALPERAKHLPEKFKSSPLAPYIMEFIEDMHEAKNNQEIELLREKKLRFMKQKSSRGGIGILDDYLEEKHDIDKTVLQKASMLNTQKIIPKSESNE